MTEQSQGVAQPPYPREPNVHSGGKQEPGGDRELPPYDERQKTGKDQDELVRERGGAGASAAGPREVSQEEREGVPATDTTAASPLGVGESIVNQGNEQVLKAAGQEEAHRTDRMDAGISSSKNIDPESPDMRAGDQGG
jgi:hypothetical protein